MRQTIRIKFQNGIDYQIAINNILNVVSDKFDFEESDTPDYIFFGPYGHNIPPTGPYKRIGYYCENILPDLNNCDWAFGTPLEQAINSPKYKRIQWHGLNPQSLVKNDLDVEAIFTTKTNFCNFLYSTPVPYRERFFKQLSKYKKVDAPGKRMNNTPSIDRIYAGDVWSVKRQFLSTYKFTIAFENYVYPGYQTEKLYDAMLCNSLPIYCGDPNIGHIFNTKSFLNTPDYVQTNQSATIAFLEKVSQQNFIDILPQYHKSPVDRLRRKLKSTGRQLKMKLQFNNLDFSDLIDQIIELDTNPDKYLAMLNQPWFNGNKVPENLSLRERWIEIFNGNDK